MTGTQTIGIDTAKRVLFLHGESHTGKVVLRKKLTRDQVLPFLANQPVSLIAVEEAAVRTTGLDRFPSWAMRFG